MVPLLWVSGIHSPDQLVVRDLRANISQPPILSHAPVNIEPDASERTHHPENTLIELPENNTEDEYSEDDEEVEEFFSGRNIDDEEDDGSFSDEDTDNFLDEEDLYELKAIERDEYIGSPGFLSMLDCR